jgi:hypothetical protein
MIAIISGSALLGLFCGVLAGSWLLVQAPRYRLHIRIVATTLLVVPILMAITGDTSMLTFGIASNWSSEAGLQLAGRIFVQSLPIGLLVAANTHTIYRRMIGAAMASVSLLPMYLIFTMQAGLFSYTTNV